MKKDVKFIKSGSPMPDALKFNDGNPVKTQEDWLKRREEIKEILQRECYGHRPPDPQEKPTVRMIQPPTSFGNSDIEATNSTGTLRIFSSRPWADSEWCFDFMVFTPDNLAPEEKLPVMICGDGNWAKSIRREIVKIATLNRMAFVIFNRCDFVIDPPFPQTNVLRDSYLERRYPEYDFASIMGWAYGFSRVIDALEFVPEIDTSKIAVTGHSRGGKASLLAGAFDERVTITCSNGSGSGGAGSWHFIAEGGEPYESIGKDLGKWFNESFPKYFNNTKDLPYDAHFLKALCLPRPQVSTDGFADLWANPAGACVTTEATRNIAKALGYDPYSVAMHFREGKHEHSVIDWMAQFEFCRHIFFGDPCGWVNYDYPYNGIEECCK